jgi:hypothetical protein
MVSLRFGHCQTWGSFSLRYAGYVVSEPEHEDRLFRELLDQQSSLLTIPEAEKYKLDIFPQFKDFWYFVTIP